MSRRVRDEASAEDGRGRGEAAPRGTPADDIVESESGAGPRAHGRLASAGRAEVDAGGVVMRRETPLPPADPLEQHVVALLTGIGEDPAREGLLRTPGRVVRALRELTAGYEQDVGEILNQAFFTEQYDEMVIVKDIEIYSLCEHHLLPFFGKCHVAYLPNGKILGLSKIARLVDVFARRLQVQERLTHQIAETLMQALTPKGVGVIIEARHLCMTMRGVEKQHSIALTSAMLGGFRHDVATRTEFLNLIRQSAI
jgi:GTP cyclohydrolase I